MIEEFANSPTQFDYRPNQVAFQDGLAQVGSHEPRPPDPTNRGLNKMTEEYPNPPNPLSRLKNDTGQGEREVVAAATIEKEELMQDECWSDCQSEEAMDVTPPST